MVGPDFHSPSAPEVKRYTSRPLPAKTVESNVAGGEAQRFLAGRDLPAEWWKLFHSPAINQLIAQGIKNSPNITAAYAALKQAEENLRAQIGNSMYPAVDASGFAQRQRFSTFGIGGQQGGLTFNLFNTSVNVSYVPDVFGGARREIES